MDSSIRVCRPHERAVADRQTADAGASGRSISIRRSPPAPASRGPWSWCHTLRTDAHGPCAASSRRPMSSHIAKLRIHLQRHSAKSYRHVKKAYKLLHQYLQSNDLLRFPADRIGSISASSGHILNLTEDLVEALRKPWIKSIYRMTGNNALAYAKIVLSAARRIDDVYMFFCARPDFCPEVIKHTYPTTSVPPRPCP